MFPLGGTIVAYPLVDIYLIPSHCSLLLVSSSCSIRGSSRVPHNHKLHHFSTCTQTNTRAKFWTTGQSKHMYRVVNNNEVLSSLERFTPESQGQKVKVELKELRLAVRCKEGNTATRDVNCDSKWMLSAMEEVAKAICEAYSSWCQPPTPFTSSWTMLAATSQKMLWISSKVCGTFRLADNPSFRRPSAKFC